MQLRFKSFDGRRRGRFDVVDEDTGEKVGVIHCLGSGRSFACGSGSIAIKLFGEKYGAYVSSYNECLGFIHGVEVVLNHMLAVPKKAQSQAA